MKKDPFLREILLAHDAPPPSQMLPNCIGDGYLLQNNLLYRGVREWFLALGFQYYLADSGGYTICPLAVLPALVRDGKVPYFENIPLLREIEANAPSAFRLGDIPQFRLNYLLHESAHCIAHRVIQKCRGPDSSADAIERDIALGALLGESFANACEAMGIIYAESEIHYSVYALNSYVVFKQELRQDMIYAVERLGFKAAFQALVLSFLFSNFLFEELTPRGADLILSLCAPGTKRAKRSEIEKLHRFIQLGFRLKEKFRVGTARFYFRTLGIETELFQLLDFKFLQILFHDAGWKTAFECLADGVSREHERRQAA